MTQPRHDFPLLNRYWTDPAFAAECDAEAARLNAESMAAMDRAIERFHAARHPDNIRARRLRDREEYDHQIRLEQSNARS